ncbi:LuxR C-terminal-related transcriptional regulator [Streptosporangium sp. NPDC005286]|uniref:response regulator transcription factor n=1 Tax=Streptosporangium sp. NPDC005286 TaxID=3154463 RepID=UPI0033A423B9
MRPAAEEPFSRLTTRERQILDLIAAGLSNRRIAECLALSPKTVRAHAVIRAREAGLGRRVGASGVDGSGVRDGPRRGGGPTSSRRGRPL